MTTVVLIHLAATANVHASETIDFKRQVLPLFKARCFACHSAKKQEAGLRLDLKSRALAGGDSGTAIRPGNGKASELVRRIASNDEAERMPPDGTALTKEEVSLIQRWIDQGALGLPERADSTFKHWAFQPIKRHQLPTVQNSDKCENEIDHFILQELEQRKIKPAESASRHTLIRRLYLDLLGLQPTWQRTQEFIDDTSPDAWPRLIDEVLASPHFGERWGRHWLDLARYADSTGYEADTPRQIWAYRDWVVEALNENMPFDQFVLEQLGGDLLPNATATQTIATGFHCNAMYDPGVRWESIINQVNTTGTVFLGLTVGCAQCHTHKTDPLTHREFYRLYAFFNDAIMHPMPLTQDTSKAPKEVPTTLVMKATPHPTHIFLRGDPAQPTDQVNPGFPEAFTWKLAPAQWKSGKQDVSKNRLDLARWIVSDENPLTARVTVNRIWQRLFGHGLVPTENDFGVQTPRPLHWQLLDRLAFQFRSNGWNLKSLIRTIVSSSTYRQSSVKRQELAEIDPENRLIAKQARIRLEAEIIRDVSLQVGGLLSTKMQGPSVFPWQPKGVLNNRATPATWTQSTGEEQFRRGIYTWIWRLTPHPHMPLFNGPDGLNACTHRDRSNVPVQALTLLNDPTFLDCARGLGRDIVEQGKASDESRIHFMFQKCVSRSATQPEIEVVKQLLNSDREKLIQHPEHLPAIVGRKGDAAGGNSGT